jgi:hypothetical protein
LTGLGKPAKARARIAGDALMSETQVDEIKAVAHLPNLDVEIAHRRYVDGEMLAISLRATPSFAAVSRWLKTANPLLFWANAVEAAWAPWLKALAAPQAIEPPR